MLITNKCKNMRKDTEQCKVGCMGVIKYNVCPWADSDDEAIEICVSYRNIEATNYPKTKISQTLFQKDECDLRLNRFNS